MADFERQHLDLICRGVGHDVDTLRAQVSGLSELVNDMLRLTPEEKRAMEASAELANAMRALVGNEEWVIQSDWAEIASRIHDLQARIILHAASRFGWTRALGG